MTEPTYGFGRATPPPNEPPTRRFPAPPDRPRRPHVNAGRLWAGGVGTAIVVALLIVVGILLVRGVLGIPVLSAEGEGAYGSASTTAYAFAGAVVAIAATALLHLLLAFMPQPLRFFYWIAGLVTAAAALLPFTFAATFDARIATAAINLVAGVCVLTILGSVGASA